MMQQSEILRKYHGQHEHCWFLVQSFEKISEMGKADLEQHELRTAFKSEHYNGLISQLWRRHYCKMLHIYKSNSKS